MPKYVVTSPDLKWRGERLLRETQFEANGDREIQQAELLVKIGKADKAQRKAPVRKVTTTKPAPTRKRRYSTRHLEAER